MDPVALVDTMTMVDVMPMEDPHAHGGSHTHDRHHTHLSSLPLSPPNMYNCLRRRFIEPFPLVCLISDRTKYLDLSYILYAWLTACSTVVRMNEASCGNDASQIRLLFALTTEATAFAQNNILPIFPPSAS